MSINFVSGQVQTFRPQMLFIINTKEKDHFKIY